MLWYSLILLLSELQEKIILPLTPLTSLCAACHSSLKKKKKKETQIKKPPTLGEDETMTNSSHKLLFWQLKRSLVAQSEGRGRGSKTCAVVTKSSVSQKWLVLEFFLSFSALKGEVTFPCSLRLKDLHWHLCPHLSSFNSFCFHYPSGSILLPPGNQGVKGWHSHAPFVPALRQSPSKEDARGKSGASQGHATKCAGLWQCCQLVGTEITWYNVSGELHHFSVHLYFAFAACVLGLYWLCAFQRF